MNDPVSVISLYFVLIGFISGIFFTRLDSWYNEVRAKEAIISLFTKRDEFANSKGTFVSLSSSIPLFSFIAVGGFITSLAILSLFIPIAHERVNPILFLYTPVFFTVLAYWIGGGVLLRRGTTLINKSLSRIELGIQGARHS